MTTNKLLPVTVSQMLPMGHDLLATKIYSNDYMNFTMYMLLILLWCMSSSTLWSIDILYQWPEPVNSYIKISYSTLWLLTLT